MQWFGWGEGVGCFFQIVDMGGGVINCGEVDGVSMLPLLWF